MWYSKRDKWFQITKHSIISESEFIIKQVTFNIRHLIIKIIITKLILQNKINTVRRFKF